MNRISSESTVFSKKVFPIIWFGFLGFFELMNLLQGPSKVPAPGFIIPLVMAVFGFILMRFLVWDLVDEVYDGGDFLLIKNRNEEDRVRFSDIMNVSVSAFQNPPRITLRLVRPSRFGSEIAFIPKRSFSLNPFAKITLAEDLIVRVDTARSARTG